MCSKRTTRFRHMVKWINRKGIAKQISNLVHTIVTRSTTHNLTSCQEWKRGTIHSVMFFLYVKFLKGIGENQGSRGLRQIRPAIRSSSHASWRPYNSLRTPNPLEHILSHPTLVIIPSNLITVCREYSCGHEQRLAIPS